MNSFLSKPIRIHWSVPLIAIGLAWLLAIVPAYCQEVPVIKHAFVDTVMYNRLGEIADTATIEHARCILGKISGDSLYLYDFIEPKILYADKIRVVAEGCPRFTAASWHNHLPFAPRMIDDSTVALESVPPASVCEPSPIDRRMLLDDEQPPIMFISVNKSTRCVFIRRSRDDGSEYIEHIAWP